MSNSSVYSQNVFINCPIDEEYASLFQAIVFTIHRIGLRPRCSREIVDSGTSRLENIVNLIADCKYGIHDLSRTKPGANYLPRFNMPFELGIDIGFKRSGSSRYQTKRHLIFDTARFRYMKFISDLNGRDIAPHHNSPKAVIISVRNWLTTEGHIRGMPSGENMFREFMRFKARLPGICEDSSLHAGNMPFPEYSWVVADFLKKVKKRP